VIALFGEYTQRHLQTMELSTQQLKIVLVFGIGLKVEKRWSIYQQKRRILFPCIARGDEERVEA
jgi:hypothetical protein